MDVIWAIVGLCVVICAFTYFFSPPKKHKDFSLSDQRKATSRVLGGDAPPDSEDVIPPEYKKENKRR